MKQFLLLVIVVVIGGLCLSALACTTQGPARKAASAPDPGSLTGIVWRLQEVRTLERTRSLDRQALEAEGMGDFFTLTFTGEDQVSGKAAPNRYMAPCAWGADCSLQIGPAAATKMFAFKEPEALKEQEFFDLLAEINRYALDSEGRLELYTAGAAGVTLIFVNGE